MNPSTSNSIRWFSWLYLSGIACSILISYSDLLDYTLLPRFGAASLCLLLSSLYILFHRTDVKWPSVSWPIVLLLAFYGWSTLSIIWATAFSEAIFESQKGLIAFAAFYLTIWLQKNDPAFVKRLYYMVSILSVLSLLLGFSQLYQVNWETKEGIYTVRGISGHKNLFSTALFLLASFQAAGWYLLNNKWKYLSALLGLGNIMLIVLLQTRSTYLALFVAGITFLFLGSKHWLSKKRYSFLLKAMITVVFFSLVAGLYLWKSGQAATFFEKTKIAALWKSETGHERLILWEKTICVIKEHPILGVGAGNWQIQYPNCTVNELYSVEVDNTTFQRPHNDWLWVWAETGFIGFLLYLSFFLVLLQAGWQKIRKREIPPNGMATLIRLSTVVGFMVIAGLSFPKERIELLLLLYILMALLATPLLKEEENAGNRKFGLFILGILLVGCSLNLYICYQRAIGESAMKKVLIYKQQKNWPKVINQADRAFSKWYTIDPTSIPVHWYRGTASFVLGNHEEALKDFKIAKQYTPYNQHVNNDLGSSYESTGQRELAKEAYSEAIRVSQLFDDPRLNLGILYFNDGEYETAWDWVNTLRNDELKIKYLKIIESKIEKQE